jgi:hypothetical protein
MTAPVLLQVYPTDGDAGIPVGASIDLVFDRGVDIETAKSAIVLYGADFDTTSGPDSALWLNSQTSENPYFLKSPGFNGLVPCNVTFEYVDTTAYVSSGVTVVTDEAAEVTGAIGMKVSLRPVSGTLAPDVQYVLYINGDPDSLGQGISSRTVFSTIADGANTGTTGVVATAGSYTGAVADTINYEITTAGDIGTAKYKWWYTSLGPGSAVYGKVTSRRPRLLDDGLQVRFSGSGFVLGDTYTTNVEPFERLATSTKITFTTNDGSYTAAPTSPATPASTSPPTSVLPVFTGTTTSTSALTVASMNPSTGSYEIDPAARVIVLTFSADVDAATITDDNITLYAYPASGPYGSNQTRVLAKSLDVSGNVVTIRY